MGPNPVVCPLTTPQICDVVLQFVDLYNRPAGIRLYAYQRLFMRRIIESVLEHDGDEITGLWSRQSGKSEAMSSLASALCIFLPTLAKAFPDDPRLGMYQGGFWVGIFAPKMKQATIIYDRIRDRALKESSKEIYADPDLQVEVVANRGELVSWSNGSFVIAQTASEQSNVEGKTFHLVIIDEAQYVVHTKVAKEIKPMLAATNGSMVKIGTAHISYGGFRNSIIYNLEKEQEGGRRNHFEFPYDKVIEEKRRTYEKEKREFQLGTSKEAPLAFHLNYEAWVEGELQRLGGNIDSDEFAMNFRLIWKDASVGAVDKNSFDSAADDEREMNQPNFRNRQVAGLDFGRKQDRSVMTIYEIDPMPVGMKALVRPGEEQPTFTKKRIIAWKEFPGRWRDQLNDMVDFLLNYHVDTIVADGTGIGDPLCEQLQDLLPGVNIVPYPFSYKSNDALYKFYLQELEAGRLTYPAGKETKKTQEYQQFLYQHLALAKEWRGAFMTCVAPEGAHDDYCDSAALGCWATLLEGVEEVEYLPNPFYANVAARGVTRSSRAERYRF